MFNSILVVYKKYLPLRFCIDALLKLYIKGDSHIKKRLRGRESITHAICEDSRPII